ncbi:MAG TPA: neutral zinc metallopeptidase, partial [Acidimicrobiales bacterium]|nr:neutral zinc metallopeptidase [Acidimicrobiales bacterium]
VAEQAIVDVEAWWDDVFPEVYGGSFEPVAGYYPYGPDTASPPCGTPPPPYEVIADNAFYCPETDIIAWDEHRLLPYLDEEFGSYTVAIVIAHEYGHAIQARANAVDRTVDLELQADCFAGAFTGHVVDGGASGFDEDDVNLDLTVAGLISIRDLPGTDPDEPYAHGSGFDRVGAFQDGFENGPAKCAEYADPTRDRITAELAFTASDYETGGDLHLYDEARPGLLTHVFADLNDFYGALFHELGEEFEPVDDLVLADPATDAVECGGETLRGSELERAALYCVDENIVLLDQRFVEDDLYSLGDFAVASEIARLWAIAAQVQLGVVEDDGALLQADCLTGRWAAWTYPLDDARNAESDRLVMSGGDLDEGIMAFLAFGFGDEEVFDRIDALRTGFFEGYEACEEYAPLS